MISYTLKNGMDAFLNETWHVGINLMPSLWLFFRGFQFFLSCFDFINVSMCTYGF